MAMMRLMVRLTPLVFGFASGFYACSWMVTEDETSGWLALVNLCLALGYMLLRGME